MIYATGDIHGDPTRLSSRVFPEQKEMDKSDYVIILGDFGLVWYPMKNGKIPAQERYWLDWLESKNFTTLFIDGNHENFDRLAGFPVRPFKGGRVHELRPSVLHLMRGEYFDLDGITFFSFGGARSHDIKGFATREELQRDYTAGILQPDDPNLNRKLAKARLWGNFTRVEGRSWWRQEQPSEHEMQHGLDTLRVHGNKVDFILTHEAPASDAAMLGFHEPYRFQQYLEQIRQTVNYKAWLFGHYHENRKLPGTKDILLYEQLMQIA